MADTLKGLTTETDHNIRVDCPEEVPSVQGDTAALKRCLLDLGINGIEAMAEGGSITLSAEWDDDWVTVEVADEGKGMTKEELEHAIDPFYTQKEDGTGLGLAMTFRVVDAHEGEFSLESSVGEGTVAAVALPREEVRSQNGE